MTTGAIAYQDLKARNPAVIPKVIAILKKNPDFKNEWKPVMVQLPAGIQDEFLFMQAARWPDDIRKTSLDRPSAHFINFPNVPGGEAALKSGFLAAQAKDKATKKENGKPLTNILEAYGANLSLLNGSGSGTTKAQALSWLFHLTGDVHQPLHTVALVTADFPKGDRGGTKFFLEPIPPNGDTENLKQLHSLWDGLLGTNSDPVAVHNRAADLLDLPNLKRTSLTELEPAPADGDWGTKARKWGEAESFPLARDVAYVGVTPQQAASKDYKSTAKTEALKRGMLAGYRLADLLEQVFK